MKNNNKYVELAKAQVIEYRAKYGHDFCTDVKVYYFCASEDDDDGVVTYTVMPFDVTGYTVEIDLVTGAVRRRGNGNGCFWTDWEEQG